MLGKNPGTVTVRRALEVIVNTKEAYDANRHWLNDHGQLPPRTMHSRTSVIRDVLLHEILSIFSRPEAIDPAGPDVRRERSRLRTLIYDTCCEVAETREKAIALAKDRMRYDAWLESLERVYIDYIAGKSDVLAEMPIDDVDIELADVDELEGIHIANDNMVRNVVQD